MKQVYVVIDTNVLVAGLLTRNSESPTVKILTYIAENKIIPVYSAAIIDEYERVLKRDKFHLEKSIIFSILDDIKNHGIEVIKTVDVKENMTDPDDIVFYAVTLSLQKENTFLVTGNSKHFPLQPFVVTPGELVTIIRKIRN